MPLGCDLPQLDVPSLALPCIFARQGGGHGPQPRLGGVGFLGWVDVIFTVPHPRPVPFAKRWQAVRDQADQAGLGSPRAKQPVQANTLKLVAVDALSHPVDLVVHAAGRIVVGRRIERRDVIGQLQAAGDFVHDLALEHAVGAGGLLGL